MGQLHISAQLEVREISVVQVMKYTKFHFDAASRELNLKVPKSHYIKNKLKQSSFKIKTF